MRVLLGRRPRPHRQGARALLDRARPAGPGHQRARPDGDRHHPDARVRARGRRPSRAAGRHPDADRARPDGDAGPVRDAAVRGPPRRPARRPAARRRAAAQAPGPARRARRRADRQGPGPPADAELRPPRLPAGGLSVSRNRPSVVANPVLVGAVTVLIVTVAVFLAYNANSGLPFVPTTELKVRVASGANVLPGNDVREGGFRVGIVSDMEPVRLPDGTTGAEITLKLDDKGDPLPVDSTVDLRPRSVLGLKYVEITRGTATQTFRDGDTLPADQATFPVELDDFYSIFDERTRTSVQRNVEGFGTALSGRGVAVNEAIADLPRFLGALEPVMTVLSDEDTQLVRFLKELGDAARVVAPIADQYANQFTAGADVFEAWSRDPEKLQQTIEKSGPTLRTGIASLRTQRPFLRDFAAFSGSVERVARQLPRTLPRITPALETGARVQRRTPELNRNLRGVLQAADRLARDPATPAAIRGVNRTVDILNPFVRFLGPHITVCNYFNYAWTHVSEHLTEPDPTGTSQRTLLNQASRTVNPLASSVGTLGAARPANGEPTLTGSPMNLHLTPYGAAIDEQGNADCESGQRGYHQRLNAYGPADQNIVVDPHIPGNSGPTFTGRPRVPEGQTFSRSPQVGPKLPPELLP
ncbi:hypothetical protein C7Y72_21925 [Paraconexibacter algicola]|uniref:Mce/MlaD domain-containing protein n=1 Tax=Paraconexibacter algicola TaxID=2133960 RepID=A0A2T4UBV3_9ACTN|nr:hypothetical protein C7Y72_21925 [Paraconexibacter algicola]